MQRWIRYCEERWTQERSVAPLIVRFIAVFAVALIASQVPRTGVWSSLIVLSGKIIAAVVFSLSGLLLKWLFILYAVRAFLEMFWTAEGKSRRQQPITVLLLGIPAFFAHLLQMVGVSMWPFATGLPLAMFFTGLAVLTLLFHIFYKEVGEFIKGFFDELVAGLDRWGHRRTGEQIGRID